MENNNKCRAYIDEIFIKKSATPETFQKKENCTNKMNEYVWSHMNSGDSYETAFEKAKFEIADDLNLPIVLSEESEIDPRSNGPRFVEPTEELHKEKAIEGVKINKLGFAVFSPFIFVFIGLLTQNDKWWSSGWIIIPISFILSSMHLSPRNDKGKFFLDKSRFTAMAALFYVFAGIVTESDRWWTLGWIIIPLVAIIPFNSKKFVPFSVLFYVFIGLISYSWQWWSLGWIIIPLTVIGLSSSFKKSTSS